MAMKIGDEVSQYFLHPADFLLPLFDNSFLAAGLKKGFH